jgi:hypothetical protein
MLKDKDYWCRKTKCGFSSIVRKIKADNFYYFRHMKKITVLGVLLLGLSASLDAQKIEKFLDYKGKLCAADTARFYAVIQFSDSGWVRHEYYIVERKLQMRGLYKDSNCTIKNGHFYYFHPNAIVASVGKFENNKKQGLWLGFHPNKFMKDSSVYEDDQEKDVSLHWHNNGYLSDSTVYKPDGTAVSVTWFENGGLSTAGRLNILNLPHGKWQFYHQNAKISASEVYENGKLVDKNYFAEDGTPMADTTDKTRPAQFPGGIPAWTRYLERKLFFPSNYQITKGDMAAVGVDFVVDENGIVKDVNINTPFHPAFNDIVLRTIKASPKWVPAISHNRRIPYHYNQFVQFTQKIY